LLPPRSAPGAARRQLRRNQRVSPRLLGSGPSFARPATFATGRRPAAVATGDVDGDGKADVVTANAGTSSVLLNRGNGSFSTRVDLPRGGHAVAVTDLNADGLADVVVVGPRGGGTVSVMPSRGGGRFGAARDYEMGAFPMAVTAADVDGDAALDLILANENGQLESRKWTAGTVSILRGLGDGTFRARSDYPASSSPMALAVSDLDGDGALDVATAGNEGDASLLINRGDGTFRRGRVYDSTSGPTWVVAADFDGNGSRDLAVAANDWSDEVEEEGVTLEPAFVYALMNAHGTFRPRRNLMRTFGYIEDIESPAAGDLNGDGAPGLVFARSQMNWDTAFVSVLLNGGDRSFHQRLDYPVGRGNELSGLSLAVADLNGDRRPDVVTGESSTNAVTVLLSTPGSCNVQDLAGKAVSVGSGYETLRVRAARRTLAAAHCRIGTITRACSD
jgi:FG-GAP-like repeat